MSGVNSFSAPSTCLQEKTKHFHIIIIIISILEPCFPLPRVGLFSRRLPLHSTTFSLHTSAIQPVLRSTCPNHLILLVRSTTSKSWMPSFVRRESELTSSLALTLQIQWIMARPLRRRRFSVSTFMAQVSAACSITLWSEGADGGW